MRAWTMVAALSVAVLARTAEGQHGGAPTATTATTAPGEAAQYDFLVGQWELTVTPKASGLAARLHDAPKLAGTWKAWRALDGWGIEDEMRIVDRSGNPTVLTHATRVYDPSARRWLVSTVDVYQARIGVATGRWQGGEMTVAGPGTDGEGRAFRSRTRLSRITPASFRYEQDRSYDGGRTWTERVLVIDARRVAATAPR